MEWEFHDDLPIYQQIMDIIKQQIAVGELVAGQKLPAVRELAVQAGVNPNTMQKALSELEREGLLYSQRTAGRFVSEQEEITKGVQEELMKKYIEEFMDKMESLGYSVEEIIALLSQKYDKEGK